MINKYIKKLKNIKRKKKNNNILLSEFCLTNLPIYCFFVLKIEWFLTWIAKPI